MPEQVNTPTPSEPRKKDNCGGQILIGCGLVIAVFVAGTISGILNKPRATREYNPHERTTSSPITSADLVRVKAIINGKYEDWHTASPVDRMKASSTMLAGAKAPSVSALGLNTCIDEAYA